MVIPPKYSKVYLVESTSSDPYLGGPIEVRLCADGVSIRWAGERYWKEIDWYQVAILAESPGQYRAVLDDWKVQAFEEGVADGIHAAQEGQTVLSYVERLRVKRHVEGHPESPRDAG